jgi:tetratricopeptide (TPR) repeat protein
MGFAALAATAWLKPKDLTAIAWPWRNYFERTSIDPKAFAHFDRASVLQSQGDNEAAIAEYTEALSIDPNFAAAYENRANVYFYIGEYDLAIVDYGRMILLRPKFVDAHFRRAVAYYNKGDYERAIAGYNEAIRLNPRFGQALTNRNLAYLNRNSSTAPSPIAFGQSASIQTAQTPPVTVPPPAAARATTSEPWPTTMWRSSGSFRSTSWPSTSAGSFRTTPWAGTSAPSRPTTTRAAPAPVIARQSGFVRR